MKNPFNKFHKSKLGWSFVLFYIVSSIAWVLFIFLEGCEDLGCLFAFLPLIIPSVLLSLLSLDYLDYLGLGSRMQTSIEVLLFLFLLYLVGYLLGKYIPKIYHKFIKKSVGKR